MSKKENIIPRNSKGEQHGLCIYYRYNGNLMCKQRYINGIRNGIHEWYTYGLDCKSYYTNDEEVYYESPDSRIRFNI